MSEIIKDKALCIRSIDYSDTSQIVTFFTRDNGKISAMAKGAKRKKSSFDGPIEIFSAGQIIFSQKQSANLAGLRSFDQKPVYLPLRKNYYAMNCGLFAAELLDAFTQNHDPNRILFDSFANFLKNIQQSPEESHTLCLLIVFQLTLLRNIGSALQIDNCCNCSAPFDNWPEIYFATRLNGLICPACEQNYTEKIKMSPKCAASLRDTKKLAAACNKTLAEIEKILIFHFTELMGKRPKLAPFFNAK